MYLKALYIFLRTNDSLVNERLPLFDTFTYYFL